jgi:hypothetical protein
MTDQRTLERLVAHLRAQVAELRRLERDGARPEEVEERRRLVRRLQSHLAATVMDALGPPRQPRLG